MVDYVKKTFIKGYFDMDKLLITLCSTGFIPIFPKKVSMSTFPHFLHNGKDVDYSG